MARVCQSHLRFVDSYHRCVSSRNEVSVEEKKPTERKRENKKKNSSKANQPSRNEMKTYCQSMGTDSRHWAGTNKNETAGKKTKPTGGALSEVSVEPRGV